jgi:hypothetical protein
VRATKLKAGRPTSRAGPKRPSGLAALESPAAPSRRPFEVHQRPRSLCFSSQTPFAPPDQVLTALHPSRPPHRICSPRWRPFSPACECLACICPPIACTSSASACCGPLSRRLFHRLRCSVSHPLCLLNFTNCHPPRLNPRPSRLPSIPAPLSNSYQTPRTGRALQQEQQSAGQGR